MPFTVFYAWQSDRNEKACRFFIRDCAEAAVKRVAKECAVEDAPSFDHATAGESGLVHIAETIKRKIAECGAIVADLTLVAEYATEDVPTRPKWAINGNVAIEFGYAMHVLHPRQIILVMNTAYGSPEHLPFDLKHYSFPIQFKLTSPDDPDKADMKKRLIDDIANAVKILMESGVLRRAGRKSENVTLKLRSERKQKEAANRRRAEVKWTEFDKRFSDGNFRYLTEPRPLTTVIGGNEPPAPRQAYINYSIVPLTSLSKPLDLAAIDSRTFHALKPMGASGWDSDLYGRALVYHDGRKARGDRRAEPPNAVTELTEDGCIFAATTMGVGTRHDGAYVIVFEILEYQILRHLPGCVGVLREVGVKGPLEVRITVTGVHDLYIQPERAMNWDSRSFRKLTESKVTLAPVTITEDMAGRVAQALRPAFTYLWREAGLPHDPCFTPDGEVRT